MYIIKNAFASISRNKGRNILIGIIITVIACACTIALAIRNTANMTVEEYQNANDIVGTISFNRQSLMENFKGGEDATKSIENVSSFATTFLIITLIISAVVLLIVNMINIRERKYEIGVFRTIGLSKFKLTMQFIIELLMVSLVSLVLGAVMGGVSAKSVGNYLLQSEITETKNSKEEQNNNFGRGDIERKFNTGVQVKQIDGMNTVVNYAVIIELLGIGLVLTFVSGLSSMISIQRFSPLTILKERS